jgi:regulator of protease activity HflC (stomatin/prohibitin superfamily)
MSEALLYGIGAAIVLVVVIVIAAVRIVNEYERGVIFRLGRIMGAKGPGLFFIVPIIDRMVKVNLQTVTHDIPPQDVITKDNVTLRVNAVTYFNVIDPVKAVVAIQNYFVATSQVAQTTLRSILGQVELDDLLIKRDELNQQLQQIIDELTNPWGIKVTLVEVKDVELPEGMRRAMGRQAEAERERRSKVIHAQGELEAAEALGQAAAVLETHPAAMQLRRGVGREELDADFPDPRGVVASGRPARPRGRSGTGWRPARLTTAKSCIHRLASSAPILSLTRHA